MVNFGDFNLTNVYIKKYEPSKYKPLNSSKTTYNLYVYTDANKEEEFFIIANLKGLDICKVERHSKPINIRGSIYKNPKTHKVLFIVDDNGTIEEAV